MLRLVALYLYFRDLQEERAHGKKRIASTMPATPSEELANEPLSLLSAVKLAA